jgi:PAS domain S-box-containing protein
MSRRGTTGPGDRGQRPPLQPDPAMRRALLEQAEHAGQFGSWCWSPPTDEISWSDNVFRLFGLEPGEITPSRQWVREHAHPDDRHGLQRAGERLRRGLRMAPVEFRTLRAGEPRHLGLIVTAVQQPGDGPELVFGIVRDVSDQRRAEHEVRAHIAVSDALAGWDSLDRDATALLRGLAEALGFAVATLWLARGDALVAGAVWCTSPDLAEFERATRQARLAPGAALPGRAWALRAPVSATGLPGPPRSARDDAAAAAGLHGAVAVPVLKGEEVLAVVELHARQQIVLPDRRVRSLTGIGRQLGEFLSHRRGELGPAALTARQLEILQLAAAGHSSRDIAERLFLSTSTVKTHFKHIFAKLEVADRTAAVAKALRRGLFQ